MKTGLHQHVGMRQDLRINPRLYQAMDLLYMPLLDLEQHLKQELLGNPFLEMIEPEEEVQATAAEQQQNKPEKEAKAEDGPDWENILLDDRSEHSVPSGSYSDAREYVEPVTVESRDLIDYLREQTRIDRKSTRLNSSHLGISYAVFCLKKKTSRQTNPAAARSASRRREPTWPQWRQKQRGAVRKRKTDREGT